MLARLLQIFWSKTPARHHGRGWSSVLPIVAGGLLGVFIVGSFMLLLWLATKSDIFRITDVVVVGARSQTENQVVAIAQNHVASTLLPRNIFFIQSADIETDIQYQLPQISRVRVQRSLPSKIVVKVEEKKPALLLQSGAAYYLVDDQGIAFEETTLDALPGSVLPVITNDASAAHVTVGTAVFAPEVIRCVVFFQEHLAAAVGAAVAEMHIPTLAARELHVILSNNWRIKFDVRRDPALQVELLERLLNEHISPDSRTKLEYIDLRIPNRVYYKLRGQ